MIGIFIVVFFLAGLLKGKNLLLPCAILAAIFPASSIINVSGGSSFSIAPFWVIAIMIAMHYFFFILPGSVKSSVGRYSYASILLMIAVLWSLAISFLGPLLFKGIGVFSPRVGIDAQVGNLSILRFSISNIAQAMYILLLLIFTLYSIRMGRNMLNWLKFALIISVIIGIYQFLYDRLGIAFPSQLLYSNTGVTIANNQRIGDFLRINGAFAEPSTAGAFFAAGAISMFVARSYITAIICCIGVLMSTSSTGYLTLLAFLSYLILRNFYRSFLKGRISVKVFLGAVFGLALIIFSFVVFADVIVTSTINKIGTVSFVNRTASDIYSFGLSLRTFGMGVGLGSNRPSSFLTFTISNIGIFGFIVFLIFFVRILRTRAAAWSRWGLATYLFAKVIGVPDLTDPWLWIWIVLAMTSVDSKVQFPPHQKGPSASPLEIMRRHLGMSGRGVC